MNPFAVHVERANDPYELRWVMHWPELGAAPDGRRVPPPSSSLGRLIANRSIRSLSVVRGDLVVRADEWPTGLTAIVHDAVVADRQRGGHWWFEAATTVSVSRR